MREITSPGTETDAKGNPLLVVLKLEMDADIDVMGRVPGANGSQQ
jgi:hypothetical protein